MIRMNDQISEIIECVLKKKIERRQKKKNSQFLKNINVQKKQNF